MGHFWAELGIKSHYPECAEATLLLGAYFSDIDLIGG